MKGSSGQDTRCRRTRGQTAAPESARAQGADGERGRAREMVAEDEKINRLIGEIGADLLSEESRVLTHCNAGALACVAHGTAISVVEAAHDRGPIAGGAPTRPRPLLQGSRRAA